MLLENPWTSFNRCQKTCFLICTEVSKPVNKCARETVKCCLYGGKNKKKLWGFFSFHLWVRLIGKEMFSKECPRLNSGVMEKGHVVQVQIWPAPEWWKHQGEVNEVMHLSCLLCTVQPHEGSVMIWGCFSKPDLGSATLGGQKPKVLSGDSIRLKCERVFKEAWGFISTHGSESESPIIKTRCWWKVDATLSGNNKCYDITYTYENDETASAWKHQS